MMSKIMENSLYLVISEECCNGRSALEIAGYAALGGVDIIQMREKDKPRETLVNMGRELSRICRERGVAFIVNDDPLLAKEAGADGVHLGQEDMAKYSIDEARKILGSSGIIGVSTHSLDQFEKANGQDVDYIAFGPVFFTKTKDYFIGTGDVEKVLKAARKRVFFIGGINLSNVDALLAKGVKNIALIRGITESRDVVSRVKEFKEKLNRQKAGAIREDKDKR
ncbi:MAG: thiamine phosphate synthase [Candidatus Omnitrophota bacterium]|jgi:thiamine-phosphate pyrophosphorylase